ncbi:MAG: hypothetical protein KJ884_04180 [Gammaproteobacteria bacterium]|nr:hypothetical protein [Gammaproteobacteria bacterium]MBU1490300.1 hypothetical protein [Gammaproteobacteria bacterium]MBU2065446.1 hypothetical protein [Gammaproteobacteria bacterium]MBU2139071.1 hypothetical protein [Gammaproteobacteria bacterium]MBU2215423.1 hypothetical protein [Gammaproteobacteria bacterium]
MKYQDWQRDSRDDQLSADSDDAPLSVHTWLHQRQRTRANPLRRFANVFGVLAVFAFSFYLLAEYKGFGDLLKAKTNGLLNPAAASNALPSIRLDRPAPRQTAVPYRIPQHFEPIKPDTLTNAPISVPQPLADCIETANLIDENVVACRYGTLPRDHRPAPSSGMVSAQYLAQYKADQANRSHTPARPSANREVDQVWIERWDGGGSYLAEWHSLNNRIDSSSVCANHRRGSIDYRECRKAAKVHFREQCRAWEKRWARDRLEWSKQMEQRYCSAANGFSPMG